ncbi:MAG: hypothetical protein H7066_00070 [Cytophagaceae bacterium]|nr:hypothetical protein [Gemmatimonadaceae bacterium]
MARPGRTAEARAQLKVVEQAFGKPYFGPEFIAAAAAELGDTATMYRWLDTGQREHSGFAVMLAYWVAPSWRISRNRTSSAFCSRWGSSR